VIPPDPVQFAQPCLLGNGEPCDGTCGIPSCPAVLGVPPVRMVDSRWHMRPRAQARHRTGKGGRKYTPAEVLEAQAQVATLHYRYRGMFPKGTLVAMELTFYCVKHPWRGDWENLAKLVCDALRDTKLGRLPGGGPDLMGAGVYHDDRQIKEALVRVYTVATTADEGVHLHMRQLPQEAPWL
jgi:Holliday junction resolvase RusA-like endonuclease